MQHCCQSIHSKNPERPPCTDVWQPKLHALRTSYLTSRRNATSAVWNTLFSSTTLPTPKSSNIQCHHTRELFSTRFSGLQNASRAHGSMVCLNCARALSVSIPTAPGSMPEADAQARASCLPCSMSANNLSSGAGSKAQRIIWRMSWGQLPSKLSGLISIL